MGSNERIYIRVFKYIFEIIRSICTPEPDIYKAHTKPRGPSLVGVSSDSSHPESILMHTFISSVTRNRFLRSKVSSRYSVLLPSLNKSTPTMLDEVLTCLYSILIMIMLAFKTRKRQIHATCAHLRLIERDNSETRLRS